MHDPVEGLKLADLEQYRWRRRVLLLFSQSEADESYRKTKAELVELGADVAERDLVVFELPEQGESLVDGQTITARSAAMLRQRLSATPGRFLLVLVGKDGTVKRRSEEHVPLRELLDQIDSMPMRQREMRERRGRR